MNHCSPTQWSLPKYLKGYLPCLSTRSQLVNMDLRDEVCEVLIQTISVSADNAYKTWTGWSCSSKWFQKQWSTLILGWSRLVLPFYPFPLFTPSLLRVLFHCWKQHIKSPCLCIWFPIQIFGQYNGKGVPNFVSLFQNTWPKISSPHP